MLTGKYPRVLTAAIVQFSLSTAHVIITLVELLEAFTYGVDPDVYYSKPGASKSFVIGFYIYIINVSYLSLTSYHGWIESNRI